MQSVVCFIITFVIKQIHLDFSKLMTFCNYSPLCQGNECFPEINMITLMPAAQKNGYVKDIFFIFPIQHRNISGCQQKIHYFKLCSSSEGNITVKKSMHYTQRENHCPRLENILTYNRSQIKNDNPLNGPHVPGHERGLHCEKTVRQFVENRLCLVGDSYSTLFTATQIQFLKSECRVHV